MTRWIPSTDGATLTVHEFGSGSPTILIAHATGFHGRAYRPLIDRLAVDHRVVAPDLRGHGDSTPPQNLNFEWQGFADDVSTIASETPAPILGFGHSMGGTALLLAEAASPGTFAALWLFEPIVIPPDIPDHPERSRHFIEGTRKRRAHFESAEAAFSNYATKAPFDVMDEDALRAYIEFGFNQRSDGSIELKLPPEQESFVYQMNRQHPTWELLPAIGCPVRVVSGRFDVGPGGWAPRIAERLQNATYEPWSDCGHFGPFEKPERTAHALQQLAERIQPSEAAERGKINSL